MLATAAIADDSGCIKFFVIHSPGTRLHHVIGLWALLPLAQTGRDNGDAQLVLQLGVDDGTDYQGGVVGGELLDCRSDFLELTDRHAQPGGNRPPIPEENGHPQSRQAF